LSISIDHISAFLTSVIDNRPTTTTHYDASFTLPLRSPSDIVPASLALALAYALAPASHQLRPRSPYPLVKDLLDRYRYLSQDLSGFQAPTC
jgi:hypothetical protein